MHTLASCKRPRYNLIALLNPFRAQWRDKLKKPVVRFSTVVDRALDAKVARKAILMLLVTSLFFFYEFGLNNIFNVLESPIATSYHLGSASMGFVASLYLYANLIFLIPAGALLDRFSPRKLITAAMFFCSTGVWLVAISNDLWLLMVARFVMGIGGGFCFVGCMRIAVNWFQPKHLATASGVIVTMGMLGGFMVQTPFVWLIGATGWRVGLWIVAFAGYGIMLLIWLVVRDCPKHLTQSIHMRAQTLRSFGVLSSLKQTLGKRQNWACAIYGGCMNIPIAILGAVWGVPYLSHVYALSDAQAATITGMLFIGTMIGSPLMGLLSDRIGLRKPLMITGAVIAIALSMGMIFLVHSSFKLLIILYLFLGIITSTQVLSYPTVAESNAPEVAGTATSIISMMMVIGGIIGQPLYGVLVSLGWSGDMLNGTPVYASSSYFHAIFIVPVIFVLALAMTFWIKETRCQQK